MQPNNEQHHLNSENLRAAVNDRRYNWIRQVFKTTEPADIAILLSKYETSGSILLFRLISKDRKAEVFSHLPFETQEELLNAFPEDAVTVLLNEMEAVDRTMLLEELSPEISSKFIAKLNPEERKIAWHLLSYPEDSVGRIMSPECLVIKARQTISAAIDYIRWNAPNFSESMLQQVFVVDDNGIYLGDISLAGLFVAEDTRATVETIMSASYVTLSPYDEQSAAVDLIRKYDKSHVAVVGNRGGLKGVVTADDVFDVAEEEATEDIQQFGGSAILEDSYFQTSLLVLMRKRAGWLALLFCGGIGTGQVLKNFNSSINQFAFLVVFMPLIISSGGNSGSQAASLIIRGLAIREMELSDWSKIFFRELATGLGLGTILATMGFLTASLWGLPPIEALIISLSLVSVVVLGAVTGAMLPFILKFLKLDPAVSSSPLIASLVDFFGLLIYFSIAVSILGRFPQ